MLHLLWSILVGFFVGLVARALVPGTDRMGFFLTAAVGIFGSIVGGLIARAFSPPRPGEKVRPAGCVMSVVGAVVLLLVLRMLR